MSLLFRLPVIIVTLNLPAINNCSASGETSAWRLSNAFKPPEWLQINFEHRTRYETLDSQYRTLVNDAPGRGGDQALVFRTQIQTVIDLQAIRFGAELLDSRIALADAGSASASRGLTTTIANPVELLQAYVELPIDNLLIDHSQILIRAGRMTMDVGSRRLIARNRYRNTMNAFTGIDMQWHHNTHHLRAFYTLPVQRRVDGNITDNRPRFDRELPEVRFWGLYYTHPFLSEPHLSEFFLFGLDENDADDLKTRDRELYTFGVRLWKKPQVNAFDYQLELIYQTGHSRTSNSSSETLQHNAHFHHLELGYRFNCSWLPRIIVQYDYASGDDNPDDNDNNRFDTLFGARRFDFGPTSIYGAFARSNLNSPGLRLQLKPHPKISTMFSFRGYLRASNDDAWTTAGINGRDLYIGTQIEARLRWDISPDNIRFETGFAHLFSGHLMDEAGKSDVTYGYLQTTFKF